MITNWIVFKIDKKLLLILILAFVLATVVGTVSHEFGHYIAAKIRGFNTEVHYAYTSVVYDGDLRGKNSFDGFIFTLGGPIQTIFTGTLGLVFLFLFKKSFESNILSFSQWFLVFLSLFWLRQSANLFTWILGYLLNGKFSERGDEIKLAKFLEIPVWSIALPTAIFGFVVLGIVVFKFIPLPQRFTFLIAGLIGGVLGYIFWLELFGKLIMP